MEILGVDDGQHNNNALVEAYNNNRRFSVEMAIRFYVTRVGELAGHLPPPKTPFLKVCRRFRNLAAHSYSKRESRILFIEPTLNLAKLAIELGANTSPRFFGANTVLGAVNKTGESQQSIWRLYINRTYEYQPSDVSLVVQLRLQELSKRLEKPVPINICEPIQLSPKTNFYSCLAGQIQQLDMQIPATEGAYGMLLIPLNCFQTQDDLLSNKVEASPCVMAMKLLRSAKLSEKGQVSRLH